MFKEIRKNFKEHKVKEEDIIEAEKRMGIQIPAILKKFYLEVGYGFVTNEPGAINRLISPLGCADIRMRNDFYEFDLDLEMYETSEKKELIFFEINEGVYASIGLQDEKIYFASTKIAESMVEFLEKIVDPDYWVEM